jgi:excisionase family DNA binding protein
MRGAIGDGALHADAIPEITAIALDIATKQDIAELRTFVEMRFRELMAASSGLAHPRYLDVAAVAAYISKSEKAVRHMVASAQIPHARIGRSIRFDRDVIAKWMAKQTSKRKPI